MARLAGAGTSSPSWPGRGSGWLSPAIPDPGPCGIRVPLAAADGVRDGPVARAAAQVPLEVPGQVGLLLVVERGRRHHHAGGAEPALEALPLHELLLHGVQSRGAGFGAGFTAAGAGGAGQALHRGHGPALRADRGVDAAVHRGAVHVDGAGPAVAAVAALFDAEVALLAQERPQALPRPGLGLRRSAVDRHCAVIVIAPLISMAMLRPLPAVANLLCWLLGTRAALRRPEVAGDVGRRGACRGCQFGADFLGEPVGHVLAPGGQAVDVVVVEPVRDGGVERFGQGRRRRPGHRAAPGGAAARGAWWRR